MPGFTTDEIFEAMCQGLMLVASPEKACLIDRSNCDIIRVDVDSVKTLVARGHYVCWLSRYDWLVMGRRGWLATLGPGPVLALVEAGYVDFDVFSLVQ